MRQPANRLKGEAGSSWRDKPPVNNPNGSGRLPTSWAEGRWKPEKSHVCEGCDGTVFWLNKRSGGWCCARCHPAGSDPAEVVDTTAI